MATAY